DEVSCGVLPHCGQNSCKTVAEAAEIIHEFKDYYGIDISYYHAWFGKELAKLNVHGDESKSFNKLVWYADAVKETNPGSLCTLECEAGINCFRRFFVSFGGCIAGFQYCIPLLFIDATFLKSKYKGQLLCTSGKNGNQGMVTILLQKLHCSFVYLLQILNYEIELWDKKLQF
ncbi:unnamed protein product, partial [Prunus brigantina]